MGGTIVEQVGKVGSEIVTKAVKIFEINTDVGEAFSEPILLGGGETLSLQIPTAITATTITLQGTNFSSNTNKDQQKNGYVIPLAADFSNLFDESDTVITLASTTGPKVWSFTNFGAPLWVRLNLGTPQTATFYLTAKG